MSQVFQAGQATCSGHLLRPPAQATCSGHLFGGAGHLLGGARHRCAGSLHHSAGLGSPDQVQSQVQGQVPGEPRGAREPPAGPAVVLPFSWEERQDANGRTFYVMCTTCYRACPATSPHCPPKSRG